MHIQTYGPVSLHTKMPVDFELSLQGTLIYTEIPYTQKSDGLGRKVDLRIRHPVLRMQQAYL